MLYLFQKKNMPRILNVDKSADRNTQHSECDESRDNDSVIIETNCGSNRLVCGDCYIVSISLGFLLLSLLFSLIKTV